MDAHFSTDHVEKFLARVHAFVKDSLDASLQLFPLGVGDEIPGEVIEN